MSQIDWVEWKERQEFVQKRKAEIRRDLRDLLESDVDEIRISLKKYTEMFEDDEYKSDIIDMMEEALMKIADGQPDPAGIAKQALRKYAGDE
ncbi:hypothetical protein [Paenibacillus lautus]|uniref:hypothetical protein n=1 Tax=Paenibacillus lautus TaxID=1401 RepID=UPI003D2B9484